MIDTSAQLFKFLIQNEVNWFIENKTGLKPVSSPVEQIHYLEGWALGRGCQVPFVLSKLWQIGVLTRGLSSRRLSNCKKMFLQWKHSMTISDTWGFILDVITLKMVISTSVWSAQQPVTGQNIQQWRLLMSVLPSVASCCSLFRQSCSILLIFVKTCLVH